jgi:hypothetical protein
LPPFPGGPSGPTGFLQRISTSGYPIVSFLSGLILTLYAGLKLDLEPLRAPDPLGKAKDAGPKQPISDPASANAFTLVWNL